MNIKKSQLDEVLHEMVTSAAKEFDLAISLVTVVTEHSQVFMASTGLTGWLQDSQSTRWSGRSVPIA